MADIKTTTSGDLDLAHSLQIADAIDRDRHLVLVRIMTVQGDYLGNPELGVSSRTIGKSISGELLQLIEEDVLESILRHLGALDLRTTVRAVPTGPHEVTVMVQIDKEYQAVLGNQLIVQGGFWHRDEPITLLDGSEG